MLAVGELALNFNSAGPFLVCKDTAGDMRRLEGIYCATSPPSNPAVGDVWLDTRAPGGIWVMGPDGWLALGLSGDRAHIAPVVISDSAPAKAISGDLWWNSINGQLFVYYQDTSSSQWVMANSSTGSDNIIDDGVYA